MIVNRQKAKLGTMLLKEGLVTEEQLRKALESQGKDGKKLGEILVELGFITEFDIAKLLSRQLGIETVNLSSINIPDDIVGLVSGQILRKHMMMPFEYKSKLNVIRVAMANPLDMVAIDDFSIITNLQVDPAIATTSEIMLALDKYYGDSEALVAAENFKKEQDARKKIGSEDDDDQYNDDVEKSPIVLLVKTIIEQAARQRASDVHIEARERKVYVRYRIDGTLYEKFSYDINLASAIVARVKIISGMDISEKRKPQDGRISITVDRKEFDIRVSILPTVFGEKIVMRLAQKKALNKKKTELGFSVSEMKKFDRILSSPNGIILVTGPTGSGKSTTLYTALSELNNEHVNIITVEDPVEANIDGINQVQVNNKADMTFQAALRSILRQDPDIIMIGEIRDEETASIAVQASITGHLVVSTLHTNSAVSTITRLVDMGVQSYLIGDAVAGIIAQRLVRRLCPHCKKPRAATPEEKALLGVRVPGDVKIFEPVGCSMCGDMGYYGRIGVYEILEITQELKMMITKKASVDQIKETALKNGMNTLTMSAAKLVLQGITSMTEMMTVSNET